MDEYRFDFIKRNQTLFKLYREFPLPVVIVNNRWKVYWCNDLARQYYSHITTTEGLAHAMGEFDREDLFREAVEAGSCTIQDFFPLTGVHLNIAPILEEDEPMGMVLMLVRMDNLIDAKDFYQTTRTSNAIAGSIRDVLSDIFSALDSIYLKADMMNNVWMQDSLNIIVGNSYRILRVAGNLTEYNRFQSGLLDLAPQELELRGFLRQSQVPAISIADTMGIPLRYRLPREEVYVRVDRARLEVAFFNLIHNALHFTRPGNQVEIVLRQNKKAGNATLAVTDKGLGIPDSILPQVTRPYFAYERGGIAQGIGLGLSIANLVAQVHDGKLKLSSKEGEGTTATLTLPLLREHGTLSLEQKEDRPPREDRFAPVYTGLIDTAMRFRKK